MLKGQLGRGRRVAAQLRPSALAGSSQILGLLQFILLLNGVGAGAPSDAYIYIYNWSLLPIHMVLVGVMYPLWLRGRVFSVQREQLTFLLLALMAELLAVTGATVLFFLGKSYEQLALHTLLLALQAAFSVYGWAAALRIASTGNSDWLSSVTLLPSLFACVLLVVVPSNDLPGRVTVLCTGLLAGAVAYLIALWVFQGTALSGGAGAAITPGKISGEGGRFDAVWFGAKSITGFGSGIALQSMAATLAPSALTSVGIISRLVGGFSTVVTNTVLPRLIHRKSDSSAGAFRYGWILIYGTAGAFSICALAAVIVPVQYVSWAMIILAWILSASISASMQRVASKFYPAYLSAVSILVATAMPVGLLLITISGHLSVRLVLGAYCLTDLVVGVVICFVLKRPALGVSALLVGGVSLTVGLVFVS